MRRRVIEAAAGEVPAHLRQFVFDGNISSPNARCQSGEWRAQFKSWLAARREWVDGGGGSRDLLEALSYPVPDQPFCGKAGCCI